MTKEKHKAVSSKVIEQNIQLVKVSQLNPYEGNSRTHSDQQVDQLAASITEFGWTNPILVDADFGIIAGHGRLMAAKRLGLEEIPVIMLDHLSPAQRKALVIADNKLAENAGWDFDKLRDELSDLKDMDYDLGVIGFDDEELNNLFDDEDPEDDDTDSDAEDDAPVDANGAPVVRAGELWLLGNHRLLCGSATVAADVAQLMQKEKANMFYSDPPYGIDVDFERDNYETGGGNGVAKRNKYSKIKNDLDTKTAKAAFALCQKYAETIVYWGANYYDFLPGAKCWLTWDKRGDLPEDDFAGAELAYTNAQKHCKIITVKWKGMIKEGEAGEQRIHPTQKPVLLATRTFEYLTAGKIVMDVFGGSGSTLIACEKTGRSCRMIEIEPAYCDAIILRWQKLTGLAATLDGKTYKEVSDKRK